MVKRRCAPAATDLYALSDDLLLEILLHLPRTDRLTIIPCVCKRWLHLHSRPSRLWDGIVWNTAMPSDDGHDRLLPHINFLSRRLASIQNFTVDLKPAEAEELHSRQLKLQACLALLSAAPALRSLDLLMSDLPLQHASFVRMLTGLTSLGFHATQPDPAATDASQLIMPVVQGLHNLQDLNLTFTGKEATNVTGFPTALSQLTALTRLDITVHHVSDMLHFGALPPAFFTACSRLRKLALNNCGCSSVPEEVACASELTFIQLLSAKPPDSTAPPHVRLPQHITKLRSLAVLQLSSASVQDAVLDMNSLTSLTLDQAQLVTGGGMLRRLRSPPQLAALRLCNSRQLATAMAGGPGDGARISICDLCLDGNSLTSAQLPRVLSWFELGALRNLDLRHNELSALPEEIKLMNDLRRLDLSWNDPLVMKRIDAQLFEELPHFRRLFLRRRESKANWGEVEAQALLDIERSFIRPTARVLLGEWQEDEDCAWDDELDGVACFLTDDINVREEADHYMVD